MHETIGDFSTEPPVDASLDKLIEDRFCEEDVVFLNKNFSDFNDRLGMVAGMLAQEGIDFEDIFVQYGLADDIEKYREG